MAEETKSTVLLALGVEREGVIEFISIVCEQHKAQLQAASDFRRTRGLDVPRQVHIEAMDAFFALAMERQAFRCFVCNPKWAPDFVNGRERAGGIGRIGSSTQVDRHTPEKGSN